MTLVEVRCPLPRKGDPSKQCNRLCLKAKPGSSGEAYCPRSDATFEFHVDDPNTFQALLPLEKPASAS